MMFKQVVPVVFAAFFAGGVGCSAAYANDPLPGLQNLDFSQYTGNAPKDYFNNVKPVGWTGGNGLIFIDSQDPVQSAAGPVYLQTYGNPTGGNVTGNYVEADGNPDFESGFNYEVTGLTPGKTYTLSFYQGASAQTGFHSSVGTTNQWIVSLGTAGLSVKGGGPVDPIFGATDIYYSTDPNASIAASQLMTVPDGGVVGWEYVSVDLTADSTTDLLSFLAWGDNGSTVNYPPIAFLAGVDSPPPVDAVPEPASWALMCLGLIGIGGTMRHNRARKAELQSA